jgi:phage tail protein X
MPVKPDSRFAALPTLTVTAPDGTRRQVIGLPLRRPPAAEEPVRHRLVQGELIDALARRYYGDEGLWWRILDANPAVYPLDFEPGELLAVPLPGPATRATRARKF